MARMTQDQRSQLPPPWSQLSEEQMQFWPPPPPTRKRRASGGWGSLLAYVALMGLACLHPVFLGIAIYVVLCIMFFTAMLD